MMHPPGRAGSELVDLRPDQLGSDVRKEENDKIRAEALRESERGQQAQKATTDQFQCGKCRKRKCTYYQMQTRCGKLCEVGSLAGTCRLSHLSADRWASQVRG